MKWLNDLRRKIFIDVGIDLGTANTIVYTHKKGFVINEPSVIAYKDRNQVLEIGLAAKEMLGKVHPGIKVIRPLADGVISDFIAGEEMIKGFIRKSGTPSLLINKTIIGVPTGITSVEKRAVIESAQAAGARAVYLVSEPMAAAIGVELDVMSSDTSMIIDIGGGTTDIAVINYGGIVVDNTLRIAGDEMNEAIIHFVRNDLKLKIGETTAENLKIQYGIAHKQMPERRLIIKGIHNQEGIPHQVEISNHAFADALADVMNAIVNAVLQTLDQLPPELASDIIDRGVILTGGGALLTGFDEYLRQRIQIPVSRPQNALLCVAEGTRKILDNFDYYRSVLYN